MNAQSLEMLLALAFGFAVAGLCASGYRLATSHLPRLSMLEAGPSFGTAAMVPLLMLCAPFLIMRSTLASRPERGRFRAVFAATILAGFWSLMSGVTLVTLLQTCGLFLA
ncbi:MAG TPA: hypothetical protein VFT69_17955 [Pseudolabrys sp.]|nr:hypothetical protein [Pseudolabrys sp.]